MAGKKQQARYAVVVTKDTVEEWTLYLSANSPTEASEAADEIVSTCMFPDYEVVHFEYYLDPSPSTHDTPPSPPGSTTPRHGVRCVPQSGRVDGHRRRRSRQPQR